ncbi:ABC transporter ATP-binding protein [Bosea sp. 117]|uniref:ABC transporter ATP-binding protein n=1 Tax=Bosea sp. 117 TaxID=1125973 RepID=UPI00068DCE3D|nr:ABC transporter ATP-binding protein [Bosea sp. 117]
MNALMHATIEVPTLAMEHLTKSFRHQPALDDVSFMVPKGALTVVLGAAGAGKTTLLRSIAGLEQPDRGRILLGGRDVAGREPKDRNLAMIFDNLALYPDKTGFDNIASPLRIRGDSRAEIETAVKEVAARLRISHILARKPKTMSGGERQRVALGRALVRTPSLFLLDEPLSSLDAMLRIELRAELRRLQRELGYTFLMATPDFAEAMAIADTVILLRAGRIVQIADPQTLYDAPVDRDAARFVGAPEINLVPARIEPGHGLHIAGGVLPLPDRLAALAGSGPVAVEAGIRPEAIGLAPADAAPISGTVSDIEPLGAQAAVTVTAGEAELRLVAGAADLASLAPGTKVGLSIAAERITAFDPRSGTRLA